MQPNPSTAPTSSPLPAFCGWMARAGLLPIYRGDQIIVEIESRVEE